MKKLLSYFTANIDPGLRDYFRRKLILNDRYGWLRFYPRHKERYVKLKDKKIKIVDSHSFVFMYQEIFTYQIYKFITSQPNPFIIDGGANIGLASIYFSNLFPDAEIISFEPDPKIYKVLIENIQLFNIKNIMPINKGLWNKEGVLSFESDGSDGGRINSLSDEENLVKIPVCSLRPFLQRQVSLLKLDIEGAEYNVLSDIADLLSNVDRIFVEYHSFVGQKQILPEILQILIAAGFRISLTPIGIKNEQPFVFVQTMNGMDNQINIFGYRE